MRNKGRGRYKKGARKKAGTERETGMRRGRRGKVNGRDGQRGRERETDITRGGKGTICLGGEDLKARQTHDAFDRPRQ